MSNRPWMPLFVDDYRNDTQRLSTLEHGAYLLLIMEYWSKGCLPADEDDLRLITRMTPSEWRKSRDKLASLFKDGPWRHKRIERELARAADLSAKRLAAVRRRIKNPIKTPPDDRGGGHQNRSDGGSIDPSNDDQLMDHSRATVHSPQSTKEDKVEVNSLGRAPNARVEGHTRASARGRSPWKKTRINLPEDWRPSDDQVAYALSVGWRRSDFPFEIERFINGSNKVGGCINIDAAWKTFCTSDWAPQNRRAKLNGPQRENGRLALLREDIRSEQENVERRHSFGSGNGAHDQDAGDGVSSRGNVLSLGARTGTWPRGL